MIVLFMKKGKLTKARNLIRKEPVGCPFKCNETGPRSQIPYICSVEYMCLTKPVKTKSNRTNTKTLNSILTYMYGPV